MVRKVEVVKKLCKDIKNLGGKAYIVGGYVRDRLLQEETDDIDIEVFGIEPSTLAKALDKIGKWKRVGTFEIYLLLGKYEIYLAKNKNGAILGNEKIKEASRRRDLSINSIYYDPLEERYIDSNNGINDLFNNLLRYVDEREFLVDPLRLLRVYTFLVRYPKFVLDRKLKEALIISKSNIKVVKKERFQIEFEKILLKGKDFDKIIEIEEEIGLLREGFPMVNWNRIPWKKLIYDNRTFELSLLILLSREENYLEFLESITYNRKLIVEVSKDIVAYKELCLGISDYELKKIALKSNIERVFKCFELIKELDIKDIRKRYNLFKEKLKPLVKGRDLVKIGFKNGEKLGEVLEIIFDMQLREEIKNKSEGLAYGEKVLKYRQKN